MTANSDAAFEQTKRLFLEGNQHVAGGRWPEAKACFAASLQLLPGRPSTLMNLAIAHIRLGEPAAALPLLVQVLSIEPDNADAGNRDHAVWNSHYPAFAVGNAYQLTLCVTALLASKAQQAAA